MQLLLFLPCAPHLPSRLPFCIVICLCTGASAQCQQDSEAGALKQHHLQPDCATGACRLGQSTAQGRNLARSNSLSLSQAHSDRLGRLSKGHSRGQRHHKGQGTRSLLYDLGCTTWRDPGRIMLAGGYGSSLPLLRRLYARNCIEFEHMWAWEATPHNRSHWYRAVPPAIRPQLTFHNVPVNFGGGGEGDAWATLRATARPEDFVVVKLDIDSPRLELQLVEALADDDELSALVT